MTGRGMSITNQRTHRLRIELTSQVVSLLKQLHATGLFGLTIEEVAARLVDKGVAELLHKPFPLIELESKEKRRK